ncbi:hypothetical protein B4U80_14012 [Leptotrombidium deliense]|uniref:Endonuclease/exonuclease/phosphatase domain-containing protein n=1 Tax=Leptotrombidium deliense TaxID=299467 RepID=A0A443S518_9ACAR|nr:hypothetical protein B4U80_14012 [Leptotrombidium deliense]
MVKQDRNDNHGGVLIAIKNDIPTVQLNIDSTIEHVAVKTKINQTQIIIVCIYIPPPVTQINLKDLKLFLKKIYDVKLANEEIMIVGDFNVNVLKHNNFCGKFREIFAVRGLKQLIKETTYPQSDRNECGSLLDHLYISNPDIVLSSNTCINLTENCDHKAINILLNLSSNKNSNVVEMIEKYHFQESDFNDISHQINNTDWSSFFQQKNNIDDCYDELISYFSNLLIAYKINKIPTCD